MVLPPDPELPPSCEGEDCPDQQRRPAHVEVKGQKLVLSERIFFDFDRDTIKPISFPVLDEVVRVLKARPDIKRMRVEEAYANQYEGWLAQRKPVVWAS